MQQKHGESYTFYRSGTIKECLNHENGKRHGLYTKYYPIVNNRNPIMITRCNYRNGKLHGNYSVYYPNEVVKESREFVDNVPHGNFVKHYSNGKIKQSGFYVNGLIHGVTTHYTIFGEINKYVFNRGRFQHRI